MVITSYCYVLGSDAVGMGNSDRIDHLKVAVLTFSILSFEITHLTILSARLGVGQGLSARQGEHPQACSPYEDSNYQANACPSSPNERRIFHTDQPFFARRYLTVARTALGR